MEQRSPKSFESFLQAHPLYASAHDGLLSASRLLATSAQLAYELHPDTLGPVADDILSFVQSAYPTDYVGAYISRVNRMAALQEKFDANPSPATIGNSEVVSSEAYSLALLLSIVFTNHRFEIMQVLAKFLRELSVNSTGKIASIGCGTGYELRLAAEILPGWNIEGYDTDLDMRARAGQLLRFFQVSKTVDFQVEFCLEAPAPQLTGQYDAFILCEVLEHLHDPARALQTLRECLKETGKMFVTMAINIAQEDHVFLYPDIDSCRRQLSSCGLDVAYEWLAPQTIRFPPANREIDFRRGNYVAIVGKKQDAPGSPS